MKMKYVQVQQQRKILQDAIIAILRVKNPKTKLQKMAKKENKKSAWKRDIEKQIKLKERQRQCKRRKNIQKIFLSKKDSKFFLNESAPGMRKSENEICAIVKINKQVKEKILAKKQKNENEICPCTAAKKDTTGCNNCYTKSEKSQNQTTENGEKRDNKKSSWK